MEGIAGKSTNTAAKVERIAGKSTSTADKTDKTEKTSITRGYHT